MFLGVLVYAVVETVIIDQMIAATIVPADVIYGVQIVVASEWVYFKNGVKKTTFLKSKHKMAAIVVKI